MAGSRVLLVDDDPLVLQYLVRVLTRLGFLTECASGGEMAISMLERPYDLVITDMKMPDVDGLEVLKIAQDRWPATPVLVLTGFAAIPDSVQAMRLGAFDYLPKPIENKTLLAAIEKALAGRIPEPAPPRAPSSGPERARSSAKSDSSSNVPNVELGIWRREHAPDILGTSKPLLQYLAMAAQVADTDCPVLITGESGTGKELLARALHHASSRTQAPFVAVNCPAIPKELVESELFGHAKGAFTGATIDRMGRFEAANNGTLFLDEIGEMESSIQSKLLRVLQDFHISRVGESKSLRINVRVLAATNRDLQKMVATGSFRDDLFYRLNVIQIHIPPLRERKEDIPCLLDGFLASLSAQHRVSVPMLDDEVRQTLVDYRWPGNIRELRNLIERLVILRRGRDVSLKHLPIGITSHLSADVVGSNGGSSAVPEAIPAALASAEDALLEKLQLPDQGVDMRDLLSRLEESLIKQALVATGGNKNKAAKILGLNRTTLVEKLRKRTTQLG
jgi:DNA-binding NtrC family response regulator